MRLLSALLMIAVFAAGLAAGFGLSRRCCRAPEPRPPRQGLDMGPPSLEALHLTQEQEAKAREIGERHRPEIEAIRREVAPKVHAIHRRMQEELEAFLTPAQRALQDEAQKRTGVGLKKGPPGEMGARRPPPMALEACAGKGASDACAFDGPDGAVQGSCRPGPRPGDPLACAPADGPGL